MLDLTPCSALGFWHTSGGVDLRRVVVDVDNCWNSAGRVQSTLGCRVKSNNLMPAGVAGSGGLLESSVWGPRIQNGPCSAK